MVTRTLFLNICDSEDWYMEMFMKLSFWKKSLGYVVHKIEDWGQILRGTNLIEV